MVRVLGKHPTAVASCGSRISTHPTSWYVSTQKAVTARGKWVSPVRIVACNGSTGKSVLAGSIKGVRFNELWQIKMRKKRRLATTNHRTVRKGRYA